MGIRGRKSAASLSVVSNITELVQRPKPPAELTTAEKKEWKKITGSMPADWFRPEVHSLLAAYCRHVVAARRISQLIDACLQAEDIDLKDYDRLLKMQERETRAIASLSVKLRISLSSQYDKSKKRGPASPKRPWDDVD